MDELEKRYAEFCQSGQDHRDDLDVDALWTSIENDLVPRKTKRPIVYFMIAVLSLTFAGAALYMITDKTPSNTTLESADIEEYSHTAKITQEQNSSIADVVQRTPEKLDLEPAVEQNNNKNMLDKVSDNQNVAPVIEDGQSNDEFSNHGAFHHSTTGSRIAREKEKLAPSLAGKVDLGKAYPKSSDKAPEFMVGKRPELIYIHSLRNLELISSHYRSEGDTIEGPIDEKVESHISISIYTGINSLNSNYLNSNSIGYTERRKSMESASLGNTFGIAIRKKWREHFTVNAGLEYSVFYTRFEYDDFQTNNVTLSNELIAYTINTHTNDTISFTYGDEQFLETIETKIVHHNEFRQFAVPLQLGVHKNWNNFSAGFNIGLVGTFLTKQQGRTIDETNMPVRFNDRSELAPMSKLRLGGRIEPSLGLALNSRIDAVMMSSITLQSHRSHESLDLRTRTCLIQLNIGLRMEL